MHQCMLLRIHFQNYFLANVICGSAWIQFRAMKTSDMRVHCFVGAGPLAANIALMRPCWPVFIGFLLEIGSCADDDPIAKQLENSDRCSCIEIAVLYCSSHGCAGMRWQQLNSQWILLHSVVKWRELANC